MPSIGVGVETVARGAEAAVAAEIAAVVEVEVEVEVEVRQSRQEPMTTLKKH